MLFRWLMGESEERPKSASDELRALVARSMPEADAGTAALVGALAGLLAVVAHADRSYGPAEQAAIHAALGRVPGLTGQAIEAIELLLRERMAELAHESLQTYTRVLYEGMERPARLEVFEVLMDLAAADELLDMQETNLLRRVARALGLADDEYASSQARHRERLSVLRGR
jgi:uncharacterized tellurite resistance protein B-like protein